MTERVNRRSRGLERRDFRPNSAVVRGQSKEEESSSHQQVPVLLGRPRIQWTSSDGAGDGNRTHVSSLGSYSSTIELHPRPGRGSYEILASEAKSSPQFATIPSQPRHRSVSGFGQGRLQRRSREAPCRGAAECRSSVWAVARRMRRRCAASRRRADLGRCPTCGRCPTPTAGGGRNDSFALRNQLCGVVGNRRGCNRT